MIGTEVGAKSQGRKMWKVGGLAFPCILLENTSNSNSGMFKMVSLCNIHLKKKLAPTCKQNLSHPDLTWKVCVWRFECAVCCVNCDVTVIVTLIAQEKERLMLELKTEQDRNHDLMEEVVKLRSVVQIGQDTLNQKQQLVQQLQQQLDNFRVSTLTEVWCK